VTQLYFEQSLIRYGDKIVEGMRFNFFLVFFWCYSRLLKNKLFVVDFSELEIDQLHLSPEFPEFKPRIQFVLHYKHFNLFLKKKQIIFSFAWSFSVYLSVRHLTL